MSLADGGDSPYMTARQAAAYLHINEKSVNILESDQSSKQESGKSAFAHRHLGDKQSPRLVDSYL